MSENMIENEEQEFASFLGDFEEKGAALSSPVLPEGKYKANLVGFGTRTNIFTYKKGANKGEEGIMHSWNCRFALDSAGASAIMKRDNDVMVYADQDTVNLRRGNLTLAKFGIARVDNAGLWYFIGQLLSTVGLAEEVKEDSGESTYNIQRTALEAIYAHTPDKLAELEADTELDPRLISSKLAELQFENLTEFLTSEAETRLVYLHIARRSNYQDKSKQEHFVKQIIFPDDFEAKQSNLDELVV
jgi:hypothetical protein